MMNRRQFLHTSAYAAGTATVTLLLFPLGCNGDDDDDIVGATEPTVPPPPPPPDECDGVSATSNVVLAHAHSICVPAADLASPPAAGVTYTSTLENAHTHDIALSQAQLAAIERGETVSVSSTTDEFHAHAFAIMRGAG